MALKACSHRKIPVPSLLSKNSNQHAIAVPQDYTL